MLSSTIIISIGQIKQIDVTSKKCSTLAGLGKACLKDGEFSEAGFSEPGGLCLSGDKLYVADTNNHCVRVMDLRNNTVSLVSDVPLAVLYVMLVGIIVTVKAFNVA